MFKTITFPLLGLCLFLSACEDCYTCNCQRTTIIEDIDADDGINIARSELIEDYKINDVCGKGNDLDEEVAQHEEMKTDVNETDGARTTVHDQCSCEESM